MKTVTLTHRLDLQRVYNLDAMAGRDWPIVDITRSVLKVADTSRTVGVHQTLISRPEPLTLGPRESRTGLPASIVNCPEIARAIAVRHIIATEE